MNQIEAQAILERLQQVEGRLTDIEAQIDYKLGLLVREASRAADAAEKTATRALALNQQRVAEDARHNAECIAKHTALDQRISGLVPAATPAVVISADFEEAEEDTGVMSVQELVSAKHTRDRKLAKQGQEIQTLRDQVVQLKANAEATEAAEKKQKEAQAEASKLRVSLYAALGVAFITTLGTVAQAALQLLKP